MLFQANRAHANVDLLCFPVIFTYVYTVHGECGYGDIQDTHMLIRTLSVDKVLPKCVLLRCSFDTHFRVYIEQQIECEW